MYIFLNNFRSSSYILNKSHLLDYALWILEIYFPQYVACLSIYIVLSLRQSFFMLGSPTCHFSWLVHFVFWLRNLYLCQHHNTFSYVVFEEAVLFCFPYKYSLYPALFVEKMVFSPSHYTGSFVINQVIISMGLFLNSIQLVSMFLSLH